MTGKAALLLVVGMGILLLLLGSNLNRYSLQAVSNMSAYSESTESHNMAVSGANAALAIMYADSNWRGPLTQDVGDADYVVTVTDVGTNLDLQSVSTYPTAFQTLHDTVRVRLGRITSNSFTLYAWMTNFEGNYFWVTGDTIHGRMHSNGRIHIAGSPVFDGMATTAKGFDPPKVGRGTNQAIFKDTYETGIAPITFPNDLSMLMNAASAGAHMYNTEIWVEMTANGTALVRTSPGGAVVDSINLADPSFNGAIASTQRVNVQGVVDGRVTIGSLGDIRITGDLVYEDRADDLLGLVAQSDVVIGNTLANSDGINIDACVFARDGSFTAEGTINGHVEFFGSVVQDERAKPFGTSRTIRYDERLADNNFRPPFYPGYYTRTLAVINWWESYRVLMSADF